MQTLIQLLIVGIAMGSIYALIALAITIIVNAAGVINFATGHFLMVGSYLIVTFYDRIKLPYVPALILVLIVMLGIGLLFERIAYHPLKDESTLSILLLTIGIALVMTNLTQAIWGAVPLSASSPLGREMIQLGNYIIVPQHIIILGSTIVLLVILVLFFEKTTLGRMARAVAQDREAASLMGINTGAIIAMAFMIAALVAGMAGALVAPLFIVTTTIGLSSILKGFAASVIGGWGSFIGAVAGGFLLGIIEVLLSAYISSTYRDAFAFIVLLLFLLIRPQGIFGERIGEKV